MNRNQTNNKVNGDDIGGRWKRGNPGPGRPKKAISQVTSLTPYKKSQVTDLFLAVSRMSQDEMMRVCENEESPMAEKILCAACIKAYDTGDISPLDTILTRALGKPTEHVEVEQKIVEQFTITFSNGEKLPF